MEKIYCHIAGQKLSRCLLEIGQVNLKISFNICSECEEYKGKRWFEELKQRRQKEEQEQQKSEDALAKGIIRLGLGPLPEPKKSNTKVPKQYYVIDHYTGKKRRLRFDTDYWKRNRFQSSLCLICQRLCEKHGWKFKEEKEGPPGGKQIALNMTIGQIMEQPEMKWMKRFKRLSPRTLKAWRRHYFISICKKEEDRLRIYVGRPKNT